MSKTATLQITPPVITLDGDGLAGQVPRLPAVLKKYTATSAQDLAVARYKVQLVGDGVGATLTLSSQSWSLDSGATLLETFRPEIAGVTAANLAKIGHIGFAVYGTGDDYGNTVDIMLADSGGAVFTLNGIGLHTDPTVPSVFQFTGVHGDLGSPLTVFTELTLTAAASDSTPIIIEVVIAAVHA